MADHIIGGSYYWRTILLADHIIGGPLADHDIIGEAVILLRIFDAETVFLQGGLTVVPATLNSHLGR